MVTSKDLSTDSKVKVTLQISIKHSGSERVNAASVKWIIYGMHIPQTNLYTLFYVTDAIKSFLVHHFFILMTFLFDSVVER